MTPQDKPEGPLKDEFRFYLDHQAELVSKYEGKFLAIKDARVLGAYDSLEEAYLTTAKEHALGTFLIQRCSPGEDDYSNTFRSRVCFV